jgi:hypothetical protein
MKSFFDLKSEVKRRLLPPQNSRIKGKKKACIDDTGPIWNNNLGGFQRSVT